MKTVVITGSTRGIGYGLASAFLDRGCQVVISGRNAETAAQAAKKLNNPDRAAGFACDVTDVDQVQALWDYSVARFGRVDIWVNNAGIANQMARLWEVPADQMRDVVETNVLGTMYGSAVALRGMRAQGFGAIYNMEGYGSSGPRGRTMIGMAPYGTTKAGIAFLNASLAREVEGSPVITGSLSPGMVVTDMLYNQRGINPGDWERSKRAFNILADRVETIAPWLADKILENQKNGARIAWLNGPKIMWRFLKSRFVPRNVVD